MTIYSGDHIGDVYQKHVWARNSQKTHHFYLSHPWASDRILPLVYRKAQILEKVQHREVQVQNNLYVNPTYITARYDVTGYQRSELQRYTLKKNFQKRESGQVVSKNSKRKIRTAIQWLVQLAEPKRITDPATLKKFTYRAGLVTLSLPTGNTQCHPIFFREVLLRSMLDKMAYEWDLRNYVWKIERQERGALHVHITVDKFIPYKWLNSKWCSLLDKHGLLEDYRSRFQDLSCREYVNYRRKSDSPNVRNRYKSEYSYTRAIVQAYRRNREIGWSRPNCSDVHSVKQVRNLAAYMIKYISKDPKLGEDFKGRYWSSSHSLSKLKTIRISIQDDQLPDFSKSIQDLVYREEDLYYISKIDQEPRFLGVVWILKSGFKAIEQNSFFNQLLGIIRAIYHKSDISELPFLSLARDKFNNLVINKSYQYAS